MELKRKSLVLCAAIASVVAVFAGLIMRDNLSPSAFFDFLYFECLNKDEDYDDNDDGSSLEEDLQDILRILPIEQINTVIENNVKYNKQISDSVAFLNDQGKFIFNEVRKIPHVQLYLFILSKLGLDLDLYKKKILKYWWSLPAYEGNNNKSEFKSTGLTGMINQILSLIPEKEVHEMLCRKSRESNSFRTFISALTFREFEDLRKSIQSSEILQRHYFWAKESGTEATFAVEMFGDLYAYLTQRVT